MPLTENRDPTASTGQRAQERADPLGREDRGRVGWPDRDPAFPVDAIGWYAAAVDRSGH